MKYPYKEKRWPYKSSKTNETLKIDYCGQSLGLVGGPGDVVWHINGSPSPVAVALNIIQENKDSASESVSSLATELAGIRPCAL